MTMDSIFTEGSSGNSGSAGFLNELGVDWDKVEVPVSTRLPNGTYKGFISECELKNDKNNDRHLVITYVAVEPVAFKGKDKQEWKRISPPSGWKGDGSDSEKMKEQYENQIKYLKKRLVELGIPSERINQFAPSELKGKNVIFNLFTKNGYQNFGDVSLDTGPQAASNGSPANALTAGSSAPPARPNPFS